MRRLLLTFVPLLVAAGCVSGTTGDPAPRGRRRGRLGRRRGSDGRRFGRARGRRRWCGLRRQQRRALRKWRHRRGNRRCRRHERRWSHERRRRHERHRRSQRQWWCRWNRWRRRNRCNLRERCLQRWGGRRDRQCGRQWNRQRLRIRPCQLRSGRRGLLVPDCVGAAIRRRRLLRVRLPDPARQRRRRVLLRLFGPRRAGRRNDVQFDARHGGVYGVRGVRGPVQRAQRTHWRLRMQPGIRGLRMLGVHEHDRWPRIWGGDYQLLRPHRHGPDLAVSGDGQRRPASPHPWRGS